MAITKIGTPELFDFSATNTALQLPTGDTASRPSAPSAGEWRFNSQLKYVEYYDGAAWFQIDTESNIPTANENFNVNTYFGNSSTQTINAKFNEAANFNGSSSQIEASGLTGTVLPTNGNWSVGFWMKPQATTTSAVVSLMTSGGTGWAIFTEANVVQVALNGSTPAASTGGFTTAALNTWMHVTLTFNSSTTVTSIYYNGGSSGADATINSGPSAATSATLKMGYSVWNYFQGQIDQVRLFNTTLSDAQVTDLYTNETTTTAATLNFPVGAGCIAAYQLDGNGDDISTNYNGTTTDIGYTGLLFQPDFVWIKQRSSPTKDHMLFDTVRGPSTDLSILYSNLNNGEDNGSSTFLQSISTNALNLGSSDYVNGSSLDYVAWNFKAGGAPTATNSEAAGAAPTPDSVLIDGVSSTAALAGTLPAKNISANTAAGFSIVKYEGTGSAATVGHGLSSAPEITIIKKTSGPENWYYQSETQLGNWNQNLRLDTTDAVATSTTFVTGVSNSLITLGTSTAVNGSSTDYIAYCFHSVAGYQKVGSYLGTALSNNFVQTDFTPSFVLIKSSSLTSTNWVIIDSKRSSGTLWLYPNTSDDEEGPYSNTALNSNGFTVDGNSSFVNGSGVTYIYLAIA